MLYAIIAFGFAIALLVLEAFIPSGGVLGAIAALCAVAGVVLFFWFDTMWGMVSMVLTLFASPFLIAGLMWVWPNTPVGRALILQDEEDEPVQTHAEKVDALAVGMEGEALTELRPIGACRLEGKRVDCLAQTGLIRPGTRVRVIEVDGMTVKVKAI